MDTEGKAVLPSCQELQAEMRSVSKKSADTFEELTLPLFVNLLRMLLCLTGFKVCAQAGRQSSTRHSMSTPRPGWHLEKNVFHPTHVVCSTGAGG